MFLREMKSRLQWGVSVLGRWFGDVWGNMSCLLAKWIFETVWKEQMRSSRCYEQLQHQHDSMIDLQNGFFPR